MRLAVPGGGSTAGFRANGPLSGPDSCPHRTTKTPDDAGKLVQVYSDAVAKTPAAQAASAVPGLPQSRCLLIPGAGGLIPHHWCLAAAGRYMIKTVARQLHTAHQQVAAQYRVLTG
jgi:hypothetical protein